MYSIPDVEKSLSSIYGYKKMYRYPRCDKPLSSVYGYQMYSILSVVNPCHQLMVFIKCTQQMFSSSEWDLFPPIFGVAFNDVTSCLAGRTRESPGSCPWWRKLSRCSLLFFNDVTSCLAGRTRESPGSCPWWRRLSRCWLRASRRRRSTTNISQFSGRWNRPVWCESDPDPYVFGPPGSGSGSSSHRYGSRIRILLSSSKIVGKTLITTVLWLLFDVLSLKNDVNVPSKSNKQKNFF